MMRTVVIVAIALILVAGLAQAQLFEAAYDGAVAASGPGGPFEGTLLDDAALVDEGVTGGGLRVTETGGVSYPAGSVFPLEEGALQMWVRAGFEGSDDLRRWFFCDSRQRFKLFKYTNGNLYFQINPEEGGDHAFIKCDWEPGEWHHVACIWRNINSGEENGQLTLYIDGAFVAGSSGKYTIDAVGPDLFVGCDPDGLEAAESIIDDVQIFAEPRFHPNFPEGFVPANDPDDHALSALGASATASTQIMNFKGVDYPAEVAIDGRVKGAYWASDFIFGTAEGPQWLEIDLGEPREVGRIYVYMVTNRLDTLLDDFTLSVRQDDEWVVVADVSGYQESMRALDSLVGRYEQSFGVYRAEFEPVTADAVRFDIDSTVARVHEIEVLPPAEEAPELTGTIRDLPADALLKFDFGTNASAVADGWLPVTGTSAYTEESGYGWRDAEHLLPTDRRSGYPVTCDFVASAREDGRRVAADFSVDVRNGQYLVGIISGDLNFAVEPFAVRAEGDVIAPRMITADANDVARRNATVTVDDGRLDLRFIGDSAWLVSAVVVAPVSRLDEVDAELTRLQDQFAIGSEDFLKGLQHLDPEMPAMAAPATEADRARGYQIFAHDSYLAQIHREVPPADSETLDGLALRATSGEREPATFALHALQPLRDVRVSVGDLSGPRTIRSDAVEVHEIHAWPQKTKMNPRDAWMVMPELLYAPDRSGETWIASGHNRQWWLTVHVPDDAPAGRYTGAVTISRADGPDHQLPVTLTVYPFALDWPRPMHWGIYYYPGRDVGPRVQDLNDLREVTLNELRDLRDHGLNAFALSLNPGMASVADVAEETLNVDADPVEVDFGYLAWVMDRIKQVGGFEGPFPLYMRSAWLPEREDRDRIIQQVARAVEDERIRRGWPELLYYPWDEPFADPELQEAEDPYRALAEVKGIRTYCTVSGLAGERLDPWLNVRCHATSAATGYQWPEVYDAAVADGDEYWWYSNCTREFPAVMRFKAGFHHWKSRATGQTYWNYRSPGGTSAFCDFDSSVGDYVTSYPGADGPIRTIQWECHREGIDDAKYAYTLEMLLAKAEGNDDPAVKAAVAQGAAVLARIRDEAKIDLDYYVATYEDDLAFHYLSDWDAARYDANRRAIASAIERLLDAGVEQ